MSQLFTKRQCGIRDIIKIRHRIIDNVFLSVQLTKHQLGSCWLVYLL